jgi:hypothetical protein
MFVRLHRQRHAGREYTSVHLCESYRDPGKGGKPRNRVVYNLGPLDKLGMDTVLKLASGFRKIAGGETTNGTVISFPEGEDFGHVYALDRTWKNIGFSEALLEAGIAGDAEYPVTELVRLMVINRICDPCSKLALLDWMEDVHVPGFVEKKPSYHRLLRSAFWNLPIPLPWTWSSTTSPRRTSKGTAPSRRTTSGRTATAGTVDSTAGRSRSAW